MEPFNYKLWLIASRLTKIVKGAVVLDSTTTLLDPISVKLVKYSTFEVEPGQRVIGSVSKIGKEWIALDATGNPVHQEFRKTRHQAHWAVCKNYLNKEAIG